MLHHKKTSAAAPGRPGAALPQRLAPLFGRSLLSRAFLAGSIALLLGGCSGDVSNEVAQEQPQDLALQQCELADNGVVGTPTDPIMVNGVETQACVLNTDIGQQEEVILKRSHNYQPLVWVLDGTYEIGLSKSYATLAELQADPVYLLQTDETLYAKPGAVVVVHRNARLSADIASVDDDNIGGGEWGGVVVNGFGYHPDCGSSVSADNFCNIQGEWGYFGGLSQTESLEKVVLLRKDNLSQTAFRTGFNGFAAEAGGEVDGATLDAAITFNAPLLGQTFDPQGVFYSAKSGVTLNGGTQELSLLAKGNRDHAVHWHSGFSGTVNNSVIYHQGEGAALQGEQSAMTGGAWAGLDTGESPGVSISGLTLVDQSLNAGSAIALAGGGSIRIDNAVVQGFNHCLEIADGNTQVALANSALYCTETNRAAEDGSNYAQQVLAAGENIYTLNPDLTPELAISNTAIAGVTGGSLPASGSLVERFGLALTYADCYGAGTLLEETVIIGSGTYRVCELQGQHAGNLYFDNDINGELIVWRINGALTLGEDFADLEAAQQQARLQAPHNVILDSDSRVQLAGSASIIVNPGVALRVQGSSTRSVELAPADGESGWGGITINGLADSCDSDELCALAQRQFVDINYLRLLNAGNGQPALTLKEVSEAGAVHYLDIADSASAGLALNGGAANIKNLLVADAAGDQVQWSNGYRGTLQYAILQAGEASHGHALHGRNRAEDHDAAPRSRPVLANITAKGSDSADTAILLEQGSGLLLYNSVVADFNTCLDIDDPATNSLQSTDPAQIHFDNVVLDCDATVSAEEEESGQDYAATTQSQSGVYEVAAVLDSNFVATGEDIPGIESSIDFSLAGASANYLNAGVGYMGSVRDSVDDWYLGWSDSVGVLLAAECDFQGVLEDDYVYTTGTRYVVVDPDGHNITEGRDHYPRFNVCGLRGTITEDFVLTTYTGRDAVAVENGEPVVDVVQVTVLDDEGNFFPRELEVERDPLPTLWLLNGLVRVGEGHLEITDLAQVEAMKADPVTLGIEASAIVMSSHNGGLHVTRGGELLVIGGESIVDEEEPDAFGPVSMLGLLEFERVNSFTVGEPLDQDVLPWRGVIVDGFGRNNQCPDAMAEAGSRICNIKGEFGYYGGYDNDHGNLHIENMHMLGGFFQLNSVGRGGLVENLYFSGDWEYLNPVDYGVSAIAIDGGAVNIRNLQVNDPEPVWGSHIRWNHGYQGTMQFVSLVWANEQDDADDIPDFKMVSEGGDGKPYFSQVAIRGQNGAPGHEDDLPRSMPTIANLTLEGYEIDPHDFGDGLSAMAELNGGSGLFLYNSLMGTDSADFEEEDKNPNPHSPGYGEMMDYCLRVDETSAPLLGTEIVFNQVAADCTEFSNNMVFNNAVQDNFSVTEIIGIPGNVANSATVSVPGRANHDIYRIDWALSDDTTDTDFDNDLEGVAVFEEWRAIKYPVANVVNLGSAESDYSSSKTVDMGFVKESEYLGVLDYFIPIEAGFDIVDD
ncbi:hypothetical protein [Microbulbifer celer]|uniref:Lipoprotein n=1 Tax=Microbulbifer celer TaxID=435905 RepID=A0ABW3UBM9_9GAMM|nr:hypothetical protein [Microbulbifer celer]UFN55984.1 hypothetical protein LPW13_10375 [Microbulbifer celer]